MAVPKRKTSKARRDKRRSSVWKLDIPGMTKCPKCGGAVRQDGTSHEYAPPEFPAGPRPCSPG